MSRDIEPSSDVSIVVVLVTIILTLGLFAWAIYKRFKNNPWTYPAAPSPAIELRR